MGARISQKFSIEQPEMIEKYSLICREKQLTLLTPVLNLEDDIEKLSQLYKRNITLRCEGKCLFGHPIENNGKNSVHCAADFFQNELAPLIEKNFVEELTIKNLKLKPKNHN